MSRKYVGQINSQNFIYPNKDLAEYDVEIIHDINDNCVSGTITSFSATTISATGITYTHNGTFQTNGAQPFVTSFSNPNYTLQYLSVHCQVPNNVYMNTWRLVDNMSTTTTNPSTYTGNTITSNTFTITPSMFGLSVFSDGTYYFKFRFIGEKCLYAICSSLVISTIAGATPTPTPTPTVTSSTGYVPPTPTPTETPLASGTTRTPTPTPTNTKTPTPTPSYTPTSTPLTPTYSFKLGTGVTSTDACIDYNPATNNNYYSYDSALDNMTDLYLYGGYPLSGTPPNGYYSDGTTVWYVTAGVLVGGTMCTFTPTPTPTPTQLGVGYGINTGTTFGSSGSACSAALYPGPTIYLTAGDTTPTVGDYFYLDQYTTPGNTFTGNGNYYCVRRGGTLYAIQIGATGQILATTTC